MDPLTLTAIKLAASFAPSIIGYFKGDKAADVATKVIDIAQTVTGTHTPEAAVAAIHEDPALQRAFQKEIMLNETALQVMYLADVQSARQRDVEMAKAGMRNLRANVLAAMAMLLVLVGLAVVVWTSNMDDFSKATLSLIIGRSLGWVEQVFSFEFGTTRSSATKDATINNLTK